LNFIEDNMPINLAFYRFIGNSGFHFFLGNIVAIPKNFET